LNKIGFDNFCVTLIALQKEILISSLIMKNFLKILAIVCLSIGFFNIVQSCRKKSTMPELTTLNVSGITQTSAVFGGNVTNDGGSEVTDRGVCWGTTQNPTLASGCTTEGAGIGTFTINITGLIPNTTYYVRAFATNSEGTSYGNEVSFTTSPVPLATIETRFIYSITLTMAIVGAFITDNDGGTITVSGVCWSTTQNPTIADNKTTDGDLETLSAFTTYLTGLTANTTYYVRAYITNNVGTAYGNQLSFTTASVFSPIIFNPALTYETISDIDGNTYKTIQIGTQTWMAENLKTTKFNDGTSIPLAAEDQYWAALSSPGYCWYNNETNYTKDYGGLYNLYAVKTGNLCPVGWHVPSENEWTILADFLGGMDQANPKIRETGITHWQSLSSNATNVSGFTALPGGCRFYSGQFSGFGISIYLWSSTEYNQSHWSFEWDYMNNQDGESYGFGTGTGGLNDGKSVRCLKD
jgi:uncharacterized protein (TIGR02145 family)